MSQDVEQKIQQLSEGRRGAERICHELSAKHPGYLDQLDRSGVYGNSIYGLWVFCDENTDDLIHLLEACRAGRANLIQVSAATRKHSVRQRYGIDFEALVEYGKSLPRAKRLA